MPSRPELTAPPEFFYNQVEARKYTTSSRIIEIQAKLSERALELLALPNDGIPRLLLDIDVALEREADGDLLLGDMGQGLCVRPGVFDGAISISAVQLCDSEPFEVPIILGSMEVLKYVRGRCLARGARAVLQLYPENEAQLALITTSAMRSGFGGGAVVDYPHSTRAKKYFLVLTCGPPSLSTIHPKAKGEDDNSSSDDNSSDEENQTVGISDRHRPRKKQKVTKKGRGREWVLKKKEQMRMKGHSVPPDTKYTARKRKSRF
ncbi:hypothetical protein ACLOJK_040680 [Asimina triloba]